MLPILTLVDLQNSQWESAISKSDSDCVKYHSELNDRAHQLADGEPQKNALMVLGSLCGMILCTDDGKAPFNPLVAFEGKRSTLPEDIPEENFEPLYMFALAIDNMAIRARLFDILWVRKTPQRLDAAELAIKAYLQLAEVEQACPHGAFPYLKRALNISCELGRAGNELREKVYASFEQIASLYSPDEMNGLHCQLYQTMAERKIGDSKQLFELMSQAAEVQSYKTNFHLMRVFLRTAKLFCKNAKLSHDATRELSLREADAYICEARSSTTPMANANFLEQAIQVYRSIGGHEETIENLHREMLDAQQEICKLLSVTTTKIPDMADVVRQSQEWVSGKERLNALISIAFITNPVSPQKQRERAIELAKKSIFSNFFSQRQLDKRGKTISKKPQLGTGSITGEEPAIMFEMLKGAILDIQLTVRASILPALEIFLHEHYVDEAFLYDIIENNPLIPQGREYFFLRGIKAGLEYDFIGASHFLILQLENSIRELLEQHGGITSTLTSTGLQREKDLNALLDETTVCDILGENTTFTLKVLLTEQEGANLRNRLAHGLAEYNELQGDAAVYLWWIVLRLLLAPRALQAGSEQLFR